MAKALRNGTFAAAWMIGGGLAAPSFVSGASADPATGDQKLPIELAQEAAIAEYRGRSLWLVDQAAWRASDALRKEDGFGWKPDALDGRGWITTQLGPSGLHWLVAFTAGADGEAPRVWAEVEVRFGDGVETDVRRVDPLRELASDEAAQYAAMATAFAKPPRVCSEQANPAVLVEENRDGQVDFLVYLLSASTQPLMYVGGHTRVTVDARTGKETSRFESARSCTSFPLDATGPDGEKVASHMVTHLNSATPTEFHAYLTRSFDQRLTVVTVDSRRVWTVDNGRIRDEGTLDDKRGAARPEPR